MIQLTTIEVILFASKANLKLLDIFHEYFKNNIFEDFVEFDFQKSAIFL